MVSEFYFLLNVDQTLGFERRKKKKKKKKEEKKKEREKKEGILLKPACTASKCFGT